MGRLAQKFVRRYRRRSVLALATAALLSGCGGSPPVGDDGGVPDGSGGDAGDGDAGMSPTNQPPVANAGMDQAVLVGEDVIFDGTGSSDADGNVTSYAWSFGDGDSEDGATVTHVYLSASTYVATLTVTDDDGATGSDTLTVRVEDDRNNGTYTMIADPNMQLCGGLSPFTFLPATIDFAANGSMLAAETNLPGHSEPPTTLEGSLTEGSFSLAGSYEVTDGDVTVTHTIMLMGMFTEVGFTGNLVQFLSVGQVGLWALNWSVSGSLI